MKTIQSVQALRGIAAMSVAISHFDLIGKGVFGVDIFFVISGFIIASVGRGEAPLSFLAKRLFRIVPLYWLGTFAIFLVALFAPGFLKSTVVSGADLLKSLFFIPFTKGSGAAQPLLFLGWTLNYEMLFYAAFCAALMMRPQMPEPPLAFIVGALVAIGFIIRPADQPFQFWTAPIMVEFLYGVAIENLWRRGKTVQASPGLLLSGAGLCVAFMVAQETFSFSSEREIVLGIPAAITVFLVLSCESRVRWPALLLMVGDASYSLYLLHPYIVIPAQKLVAHFAPGILPGLLAIPVTLALVIAFSVISYRIVERPANILLRKWLLGREDNDPVKAV